MDDVFTDPFGQVMRDVMIVASAAPGGAGDAVLMESGDYLLLESGDKILLEGA